ncbi:hypothetical protein D9M71_732330 [compost metagenome]
MLLLKAAVAYLFLTFLFVIWSKPALPCKLKVFVNSYLREAKPINLFLLSVRASSLKADQNGFPPGAPVSSRK